MPDEKTGRPDEQYVVQMKGITKVYPNGVAANQGVDFNLRRGEIHALMGENGAGKSTLMKMLFGLEQPTSGEIWVHGEKLTLSSPTVAISHGIGMVHQHFMLVPSLTVAENMVLGMAPRKGLFIDHAKAVAITKEYAEKYNLHVEPEAKVMDIPVGMKNPTSGDLSVMLNSVIAAQHPHHFIYRGCDVETSGNELAHTILRGGVNKYGQTIPNYHYEDLMRLYDLYGKKNLKNPAAIVDVNHSNSGKQFKEQIRIVSEVLHSRNYNPDVRKLVKGVMIESYLLEGRQDISDHMTPGCSITDPCLGWEDTERLLYDIAEKC